MMANSLYVGHLGPIPLYVHWSALFLVYMAWLWIGEAYHPTVFISFLFILIASIVLHELGHGFASRWVARNEGERSITITLWAFGGVCASQGGDPRPWKRLIVVLAGPLVSLLLWFACWAALDWCYVHAVDWLIDPKTGKDTLLCLFLELGLGLNQALFIFNMLPIYPLDGGQTLYNGLKLMIRDYVLARKLTMAISIACALTYFAWRTYENDNRIDFMLAAILAWALYTGWISLSRYHL